ncbi:putative proliferation-associated protein 2G4 [Cardiosporidium cionae]|uniref:Proliferation-associated protein 2G4 n=1 Tax=Cardiosporidium cionae TaxID=476202 RepID=A0ABQ7JF07_9APIC|nr:putative proliferation-associated protein 2G4 [Cardiosporidium cionae]|eukprot:KAF8822602.1 putative proliferation-associated protein 2G4 [Cardiosporidium cionae]
MSPDVENKEDAEAVMDLSNPDITTKYHSAADIVNLTMSALIPLCIPGADICTLCKKGDAFIENEASKIFNKKEKGKKGCFYPPFSFMEGEMDWICPSCVEVEKGIAFPTCVSVNEICANFSPLEGESSTLKAGDLVKVDLGCHIDGFISMGAHSFIIGEDPSFFTGRRADVLKAAHVTAEAALRVVKVGNKNTDVTKIIEKAAHEYGCAPVAGSFSHEMKHHLIEGSRTIPNKESHEEKVEEFEFGPNEVYSLDILVSSGDGKVKESDIRTTVFKRAVETNYTLKSQLARTFISEVNKRFPLLPFTIRAVETQKACRMGVSEAMRHELLSPYSVMTDKGGEFVAHFKYTVLLLPGGTKKITGLPFTQKDKLLSSYEITDEEIKKLLASSLHSKKKKKKSKSAIPANETEKEYADVEMHADDE